VEIWTLDLPTYERNSYHSTTTFGEALHQRKKGRSCAAEVVKNDWMYTFTSSICFSGADRDNFAYVHCSSLFFQGREVWLFQSRLWLYICWMFIVQCLLMFVKHYIEPCVFPNTTLHSLRVCITSEGAGSELTWAESKTLLSVRNITAKLAYAVTIKMQVFWKRSCVVQRTAWPWSSWQYHTLKRRKTDAHWHCVTSQKHGTFFVITFSCPGGARYVLGPGDRPPCRKSTTVFVSCSRFINVNQLKLLHSSPFLNHLS
jgi:hypothetical protein